MNLTMEYEDKISFSFPVFRMVHTYILHKPGYAFQRLFFYHEELGRRGNLGVLTAS